MSKEEIEKLLDHYGVLFTEVIADKLLEIITRERADAIDEIIEKFSIPSNSGLEREIHLDVRELKQLKEQNK